MAQTHPHIIVLGAGLIGLCTADHLQTKGANVTVIDAHAGPCQGTSFSNSGMIHPSQACSWAKEGAPSHIDIDATRVTADLGQRSAALLKTKLRDLGLPMRAEGCVQIYSDFEQARAAQTGFNALDLRADILIDPVETFGHAACVFPDDLSGNAYDFGCALADDLKAKGVSFLYDIDNFAIRKTDEEQLKIMAGENRISCDHLVLAAGVQTPQILATLGVQMQLESVAGVAVNFARSEDAEGLPTRPIMDAQTRTALTVFKDHVRISGGWGVTEAATILERWADLAPGLLERLGPSISSWVGHRPVSPMGRPYISSTSIPGLWVNTGHGHMGWTLCAGSGELLARMILDGVSETRFAFTG